jgi:sporulation protein YlmC with PRC-barrel domain
MARVVHLERLLNKKVLDSKGRKAGRIEEVCVRVSAGGWVVEAYLLGKAGLLARLSVPELARSLLGLRSAGRSSTEAVPWDKMDLMDPHRPRLKCTVEELKAMQPKGQ